MEINCAGEFVMIRGFFSPKRSLNFVWFLVIHAFPLTAVTKPFSYYSEGIVADRSTYGVQFVLKVKKPSEGAVVFIEPQRCSLHIRMTFMANSQAFSHFQEIPAS